MTMAEIERTRERERPPFQENPYERILAYRRALRERNLTGPVVVKSGDREMSQARQGRLKFFLDPLSFKETPLQHWRVFMHEIKTRSGKHTHQGGLVIYVIEGKGYSVIDGERIDWAKGDLVLLPMKPEGVEHQHFNLEPEKPCLWIAFIHLPIIEHLASDLQQREASPDFKEG
jgi:mannose-6-phosphate isomerase-like protein (cupin superfamily)